MPPPLLLLTRPEAQAQAFAAALEAAGARFQAVISPLIATVETGPLPPLDGATGLIFSSAAGVRAYTALGGPGGLRAWTVGAATARAARAAGLDAAMAGETADALVAALIAAPPRRPLLHLHGRHTRGAIADRLTAAGVTTSTATIYEQPARPPTDAARAALQGARPVVAPLFSPRTAALLATVPRKSPLLVAAMSDAVANAARPLHSRALRCAARPDHAAMVALTARLLDEAAALETQEGRE